MIDKISKVVNVFFEDPDFSSYYLVELKINKHTKKIEVYIDGDEGVSFGICRKVSRSIEAYLDEQEYNGGKYTLDVSSPGVDNPLRLQRQYVKNIGRDIKVDMVDNDVIKGELREVDDKGITVFFSKKKRNKKTKKKELIEKNIKVLFEDIKTAVILTKI